MTLNERIDEQSFRYDPEFPPDVAEGLPLRPCKRPVQPREAWLSRAARSCRRAASAGRRARS